MSRQHVEILDTTLRDGAQREGISFSVVDKLRIAQKLDELGVSYVEGGWPGSNPKDAEFFARARELPWAHAKLAAFGSTRRPGSDVTDDPNLKAMIDSGAPVAVIVGKADIRQVYDVLRTTPEENLAMIRESTAYLCGQGLQVIFDAEHYFDGYEANTEYALETCRAAYEAGASCLVLCETNGGMLPGQVYRIVSETHQALPEARLGMHAHNDSGMADANTLVAVEAGATHVHGTINGYGERCGNANLCVVIPGLEIKMACKALLADSLHTLAETSNYVAEIANMSPDDHQPYVGRSAFAHKAGLHVNALAKSAQSYQHVEPELVGNQQRILVSELAGRANVSAKLNELNMGLDFDDEIVRTLASELKMRESQGFQYEGAEGSFELLVRRRQADYAPPFQVLDFLVRVEKRSNTEVLAEATVKALVDGHPMHTAAEGDGPVNALDRAMRKAFLPYYPELEPVHLHDYKVRILDPEATTGALTRVMIDATNGETTWTTVGCSVNIIEASFQALLDSYELPLLRRFSS